MEGEGGGGGQGGGLKGGTVVCEVVGRVGDVEGGRGAGERGWWCEGREEDDTHEAWEEGKF